MEKMELIQKIGDEICEDCGPNMDCGLELDDCSRVQNALNMLDKYNKSMQPNGSDDINR